MRDAFGRLLTDPAKLDFEARVECMRRLAGELQASRSVEQQWLGRALLTWLSVGGDLRDALGVKPPQGSRCTAQALVAQDRRDRALLRLSAAAGSDCAALRILRGDAACPATLADLLQDAQGCPASRMAFTRARRRASSHGA